MKKYGLALALILGAMILTGAVDPAGAAEKNMRLGWVVARQADHPYTVAAETFSKTLTEKTKGQVKFDLFPGGQLGGDKEMFEAIQMGTLDVGVISAPVVAAYTKILVGTDMPYIFNNDYDLVYKAEAGEAGKKLLKKLEEKVKLRALSFTFQPFRHFFTRKEIKGLDDLKGLKLRTMQSPVHIDIFKSLGMNPTPIPYTEVYTAMQAGTIDGFESDVIGANASKFYEVSKFITISGHFNNAILLLMSMKAWNSLTPEEKAAAETAAVETAKASLAGAKVANEKYMQVMKDQGVKINQIDAASYTKAVKPVIEKYSAEIPEVKEFVLAVEKLKK
ncbi:MAG: TRAP transporter substrate-binding protein [Thermodesulfobacteriota bacterium]